MGRYKNQKSYIIEKAVSGRSTCRICQKLISGDEYRVGTPHPDYDNSYKWHHLSCAVKRKMIKETTSLEGENAVWVRAALRAADEHRTRTGCDCATVQLVSETGCCCGVSAFDYHKSRPELPENALPVTNRSGIFQPGETIRGDFSQATAEVVSRKDFVPRSGGCEPEEEENIVEDDVVTAASVLAEAVEEAYYDVAQQIAGAKAAVEIAQETFVPQMRVWGVFDSKPYILLEEQSDTHWLVADGPEKEHCIRAALLTPYAPSATARFLGYLSDHRFRIALMMMAFFGYLTAMLIGMGLAAFSAMP